MPHVPVRGVQVWAEWGDAKTGVPLAMVTGMANALDWLLPLARLLEADFQWASFDYPGCGRSGPTEKYDVAELADTTVALMQHLGHERFDVLGLSMGGMVVQELLVNHRDRVTGAVLVSSAVQQTALDIMAAAAGAPAAPLSPAERVRASVAAIFSPEFRAGDRFEDWAEWQTALAAPADALAGWLGAAAAHDVLDRLEQVDVPVLVVTGDADVLARPEHSKELAARLLNSRLVVVEGGAHGLVYEHPELVADAITEGSPAAAG